MWPHAAVGPCTCTERQARHSADSARVALLQHAVPRVKRAGAGQPSYPSPGATHTARPALSVHARRRARARPIPSCAQRAHIRACASARPPGVHTRARAHTHVRGRARPSPKCAQHARVRACARAPGRPKQRRHQQPADTLALREAGDSDTERGLSPPPAPIDAQCGHRFNSHLSWLLRPHTIPRHGGRRRWATAGEAKGAAPMPGRSRRTSRQRAPPPMARTRPHTAGPA